MTQDLCMGRAAGNGAFFTGGACHFPKGCSTRSSHAGFTWVWLGFTPSAFSVFPPVLEHGEPSWCSKILNLPHLGCTAPMQISVAPAPGTYGTCDTAASLHVPSLERAPGKDCTKCSDQNLQQCEATCVWASLLALMRFAKRIYELLGCCSAPFQEKKG